MNSRDAIRLSIEMAEMVSMSYLGDLSDADLMRRPHAECNHLNWQVGHLVVSEHDLVSKVAPGQLPALPAGFADKYSKDAAKSDDAAKFATKEELMRVHSEQKAAILAALDKCSDADLDKSTGVEYAPTVAAMYSLQSAHWLMHAGQWVIVRRQLGKPVVI